jgi:integrase
VKTIVLKPKRVEKKYSPWMLEIPKSITGSRRVRKFFSSREDADGFIARLRMNGWQGAETRERAQVGARRVEADAEEGRGMRLAELVQIYLGRQEERVGAAMRRQLRYVFRSMEEGMGNRRVDRITHQELEAWLGGVPAGTTRWNHYRVARRLWTFAIDWLEVMERNPFRKIAAPEHGGGKIEILTPEEFDAAWQAGEELTEPKRSRWFAYLALAGMAGLRTEEIFSVRWEDVTPKEIFVRQPKRVRGWMPRYVRRLARFDALWANVARPAGVLETGRVLPGGQRELYTIRRSVMDRLGWERWPQNCLRHSYGTYHLAEFRDLAALRTEMGHESEGVTRRHYATAARGVDAAAWWRGKKKLKPENLKR